MEGGGRMDALMRVDESAVQVEFFDFKWPYLFISLISRQWQLTQLQSCVQNRVVNNLDHTTTCSAYQLHAWQQTRCLTRTLFHFAD